MMETPGNEAGRQTEYVMLLINTRIHDRKEPKLTTGQYNAIYETVYDALRKA